MEVFTRGNGEENVIEFRLNTGFSAPLGLGVCIQLYGQSGTRWVTRQGTDTYVRNLAVTRALVQYLVQPTVSGFWGLPGQSHYHTWLNNRYTGQYDILQ